MRSNDIVTARHVLVQTLRTHPHDTRGSCGHVGSGGRPIVALADGFRLNAGYPAAPSWGVFTDCRRYRCRWRSASTATLAWPPRRERISSCWVIASGCLRRSPSSQYGRSARRTAEPPASNDPACTLAFGAGVTEGVDLSRSMGPPHGRGTSTIETGISQNRRL